VKGWLTFASVLRACCSNNLLYPKEDKEAKALKYACRRCDYEEEADTHVVYKNELESTAM
jgi:DNA-directed RNA polymerase II subunit RPB9